MTEHKNRTERRSFQVIELRIIRTKLKKHTKSLPEGSTYNAKKFRKTFFYYNLKKQSGGMAKGLTTASDISCSGPATNTTTLSNIPEVSDSSNSFVSDEQIQNSLVKDSENLDFGSSHDVSSLEHSSMIVEESHKNRAERRSFQVIELRRIRTELKKHTKSLPEGSTYNAKKFRKTLFYYNLKEQSGGMAKGLAMASDISCSGMSK